jgi:V8-like Glu-specific endopeptidase
VSLLTLLVALLETATVRANDDAELKSEITRRINVLADYLDKRAGDSDSVEQAFQKLGASDPAQRLKQIVRAYPDLSGLLKAQSQKSNTVLTGYFGPIAQAEEVTTTFGGAASELRGYANYLRTLSEKIASVPTDQAVAMLQAAYVPKSVQIVVNPPSDNSSNYSTNLTSTQNSQPIGLIDFISNGNGTVDYPSVAALLYNDDVGGLSPRCTATLIAPNAVLTARHCLQAPIVSVYFQHFGPVAIDSTVQYQSSNDFYGDLAIVFLQKNVTDIVPSALNTFSKLKPSTQAQIVGYGWHNSYTKIVSTAVAPLIQKTGVKLYANVDTNACERNAPAKSLICWTYKLSAVGLGSTCEGDSGGPLFANIQGHTVLAGVTVAGRTCAPGDKPIDTEVFDFANSWILPTLKSHPPHGTDSEQKPLAPQINPSNRYVEVINDLFLEISDGIWSGTFATPAGISTVRIGLDAVPTGYPLRLEVGPVGAAATCVQSQINTGLLCEISAVAGEQLQVKIAGQGNQEIQLVATPF